MKIAGSMISSFLWVQIRDDFEDNCRNAKTE